MYLINKINYLYYPKSFIEKIKIHQASVKLKNVVATSSFLSSLQLFHHPCGMFPYHHKCSSSSNANYSGSYNNIVFFLSGLHAAAPSLTSPQLL